MQMLGYQVDAICPGKNSGDKIATAVHDFGTEQTYFELPGHHFALNKDFDKVNLKDYQGLYLPGGRAPEYLRGNDLVMAMVKHFLRADLPVAAICHGVQLLS